jgi:hypothetical protein
VLRSLAGWRISDGPCMTVSDRTVLRSMREAGQATFFRTAACDACGIEVAKGKRYCSYGCMEREAMWEPLTGLQGKRVSIETTDGCRRNGKFTGVTWGEVEVQGQMVRYPVGVRLDNEPGDELPWIRLRWLREAS